MILLAPLCNAAAIVDVARNTSMITTMLLLTSYKFNNAGEREVNSVGLFKVSDFRCVILKDQLFVDF